MTYPSLKLSKKFNVKDKTEFYHQSNLVYYGKCPNQTCTEDYIGETDRKNKERTIDNNKRDQNSHILRHSREEGHTNAWGKDVKVLGNNYRSEFKRKISEALFINQLKPSLNVKEQSIWLHLYNWLWMDDGTHLRFQILIKHCLLLLAGKDTCYFSVDNADWMISEIL